MEQDAESIMLTQEDKIQIYQPWKNSIIIKLFGKKLAHPYLKQKLQDLWKPTEPLNLIDLGQDYYTTKFKRTENAQKVLHEGPWFVTGEFLSVKEWEPNFVPEKAKLIHTTI